MQIVRSRQLLTDLSHDGTTYTSAKAWAFPAATTFGGQTLAQAVHGHADAFCFVDAGRAEESYTETGSEVAPYRTLSQAITDKLTHASTDNVIFKLAPGRICWGNIGRPKCAKPKSQS